MLTSLFLALLAIAPTTQSTKPAAPATTRSATPVHRTVAEAKQVHDTAIAKASEQYLQAQIAAKRAYIADLNSAVAIAIRAENLEQANQAKAARDAATRELELLSARLKADPAMPVGTWRVTYTNGAAHTCRIDPDGTWAKVDVPGSTPGRVRVMENGDVVVRLRDGDVEKAERYMMTTNGLLVIEHFNPASGLGNGPPTALGIGRPVP